MEFYNVLDEVMNKSGMNQSTTSKRMGRASNYISVMKAKGSIPSVNNAAAMMAACDYALVAVPRDSIPDDALIIDTRE